MADSGTDHYKTLGVDPHADAAAIKKAYRNLVRQHHPDKAMEFGLEQGLTGKELEAYVAEHSEPLKQINVAWGVLGDEQKRKAYDQFGALGRPARGGPGGAGGFSKQAGDPFRRKAGARDPFRSGAQPGEFNFDDFFEEEMRRWRGDQRESYRGAEHEPAYKFKAHTINANFKHRQFAMLDSFDGKKFTNCDFTGARMPGSAQNAQFIVCIMRDMQNTFTSFKNALFDRIDFSKKDFCLAGSYEGATFRNCIFHDAKLEMANINNAKFEGSIEGLVLPDSYLETVDLTEANTSALHLRDSLGKVYKPQFDAAGKPIREMDEFSEALKRYAKNSEPHEAFADDVMHDAAFDEFMERSRGASKKNLIVTGAVLAVAVVGSLLYKAIKGNPQKNAAPWSERVAAEQPHTSANR